MLNIKKTIREVIIVRLVEHLKSPLFFNGYALTVSSAATSVIGLLYWALAARYYSAEVVGKNSAAIAMILFLSGLSGLNLDNTLVRFIPRAGQGAATLLKRVYGISLLVALLISPIFLIGLHLWSSALSFLSSNIEFAVIFVLAVLTGIIFVQEDGALTGMRQAKWVVVENAAYAILKLAMLIFLAGVLPQYGILLSWIVPVVFLIPIVNYFIFRRFIPKHIKVTRDLEPEDENEMPIVKYTASNYLGFLFYNAYAMLPPLLVIQLVGSQANAYFYLPWVIANSLRLFTINMSTSMTVEGSLFKTKSREYFRQVLIGTLRILVPVVFVLVVGAPILLSLFGHEYSIQGTTLLRLLTIAVIPNVLVSLFLGISRLEYHFRTIITIQGVFAILSLGIAYFLLPIVGVSAVGIAWLASQSLLAAIIFIYVFNPASFSFGWKMSAQRKKGEKLVD